MKNIPTVLVIFGATGDLISKKIAPALYHLFTKKKLPNMFKVIGYSRRKWNDEDFRQHIREIIYNHKHITNKSQLEQFVQHFFYHEGNFDEKSHYESLATEMGRIDDEWKVCSNKLFYLAVPPNFYSTIFSYLYETGLTLPCGPDEGWTRVIVEKPFGHDLKTAESLDMQLAKFFKEEQIYRIDHYLAKEMLQNILNFRFSNNLFEESWNNKFIEKIEIRALEKLGVEERGGFYDGLGALRDFGQNHLLQMLALVTMERPESFQVEEVRSKRTKLLTTLIPMTKTDVENNTFRAQYEGYRDIEDVNQKSITETYFKVKLFLKSPRWQGVPIYLESGKRLKTNTKEVVVTFKHPSPCLCPPGTPHRNNVVRFQLEPLEKIQIEFLSKEPGLTMGVEQKSLDFYFRSRRKKIQFVEEYEKLLLDCIEGNQLLFISTDEVKPMWRFVDSIIAQWEKDVSPTQIYKPDSNAILKKSSTTLEVKNSLRKELGIIGLGKMGGNIALQLLEKHWGVVGYNRTKDKISGFLEHGLVPAYSFKELTEKLSSPRIIWLMLPAGQAIDDTLFGTDGLINYLEKGDIVVEAGNSLYKDAQPRYEKLKAKGIQYIDVGVSGGPGGARHGACLMVGGERKLYEYLLPLFVDMALPGGVAHVEGIGGGHFVKMVHNGIEYGMMQAIGEGFEVLKKIKLPLDLEEVARIYNTGSVIESRLVGWLEKAYKEYGPDLQGISGSVGFTGEGEWTVNTAKELDIPIKVIEDSFKFRQESQQKPSYTGKVVSALRNQFGGHKVSEK